MANELQPRILDEILENKRAEIAEIYPRTRVVDPYIDFFKARSWPAVIAEIKPKSLSGSLYQGDPVSLAESYQRGGASIISVLTDERFFGGSIQLFRQVLLHTSLPLLRKDFIIHPKQLLETELLNAGLVLLIVRALQREGVDLKSMIQLSEALEISPVTEVYDEKELDIALTAGAQIIGVNSRNLDTFEENIDQALDVLKRIPPGKIPLLFSSIKSRDDVLRAHQAGAKGVLVGTSLLKAQDPAAKLRELTSH